MPVARKCLGVPGEPCSVRVLPPASRCAVHAAVRRRQLRNPGYDDPRYRAARELLRQAVRMCDRCGTRRAVVVHHRDRDPTNNAPSNHEDLCADCHNSEHGRS